jgi:hypothetical protein
VPVQLQVLHAFFPAKKSCFSSKDEKFTIQVAYLAQEVELQSFVGCAAISLSRMIE